MDLEDEPDLGAADVQEDPKLILDEKIIDIIKGGTFEEFCAWFEEVRSDIGSVVDIRDEEVVWSKSTLKTKASTALHYAAFYGKFKVMKHLLVNMSYSDATYAGLAVKNEAGQTALHCAICAVENFDSDDIFLDLVELLLEYPASAAACKQARQEIRSDTVTSLLEAVYLNLPEIVAKLLESYEGYATMAPAGKLQLMLDEENTDEKDLHLTKLADELDEQMMATQLCPELGMTEQEIENIQQTHTNPQQMKIALFSAWKQREALEATYESLLRALVKINNTSGAMSVVRLWGISKITNYIALAAGNHRRILEKLLKHIKDPSELDVRCGPYAPLHLAVLHRQKRNTKMLCDAKAGVTIKDDYLNYPIHYAIEATDEGMFKSMIHHLRDSIDKQNKEGCTLVHLAVINNKTEFVKILCQKYYADFKITDYGKKRYPIHYLCEKPGDEMVDLVHFLADRYSVRLQDKDGHAPLHLAVKQNNHMMVEALLKAHGRLEWKDFVSTDRTRNCIHFAVLAEGTDRHFENMISLLSTYLDKVDGRIAMINQPDDGGKTALYLTIKNKKFSRTKILLGLGAEIFRVQELPEQGLSIMECLSSINYMDGTKRLSYDLKQRVSNYWIDFGTLIGMGPTSLDEIGVGSPIAFWLKVMQEWLNGRGAEYYPVGWEGLYEMLEDVNMNQVAEELKNAVNKAINFVINENIHSLVFSEEREKDFKKLMKIFQSKMKKEDFKAFVDKKHDEKTALHLAIQSENFSRVETLLNPLGVASQSPGTTCIGADPSIATSKGQTLIHLAVTTGGTDSDFEKVIRVVEKILPESEFETFLNQKCGQKTALHMAIENENFMRVKILLNAGANPGLKNSEERTLIHLAVTNGTDTEFEKVVKKVRQRGFLEIIDAQDKNGKTALHLALEKKKTFRAKVLLEDHDADSSLQDSCRKNCLHIAFEKSYSGEIIKLLMDKAKRMPDIDKAKDDSDKVPLQYLNESTPASAVNELAKTKLDNIDLSFTFKRSDILKILLVKGARVRPSTLETVIREDNVVLAKILVRHAEHIENTLTSPMSGKTTTLFNELIIRMPSVAKEALERLVDPNPAKAEEFTFRYSCIQLQKTKDYAGPIERSPSYQEALVGVPQTTFETNTAFRRRRSREEEADPVGNCFQHLCQRLWIPRCGKKYPLQTMVDKERIELLKHPLVRSYLYTMWFNLGALFFFFIFGLYASFLVFLSLFSLTVNNPLLEICNSTARANMTIDARAGDCGSYSTLNFSYYCAGSVIFLAFVHIVKEIFQCFNISILKYIQSWQNLNEVLLFPLSIVYVAVFGDDCGCPSDVQWQIGIFVLFLAWINLIIMASEVPSIGIFVIIFKEIFLTFVKLIVFSILLIFAFAIILYMMFRSPNAEISSFSNIGHSFVKTITMVTGELGFEDIFNLGVSPSRYDSVPFVATNFIMWIFFLVLIPIILNNMLISLAVGDAKEINEKAEIKLLKLQVNSIIRAFEIVPNFIKRLLLDTKCCCCNKVFENDERGRPTLKTVNLKEKSHLLKRIILKLFFGGKEYLTTLEKDTDTYNEKRNKERDEIEQYIEAGTDFASRKLDQLCETVETLREKQEK